MFNAWLLAFFVEITAISVTERVDTEIPCTGTGKLRKCDRYTPFTVWSAISRGEIGGAEAMGKQMYTVTGDFSLMVNWDKFFGSTSAVKEAE